MMDEKSRRLIIAIAVLVTTAVLAYVFALTIGQWLWVKMLDAHDSIREE